MEKERQHLSGVPSFDCGSAPGTRESGQSKKKKENVKQMRE
jgi:hypothetical protein